LNVRNISNPIKQLYGESSYVVKTSLGLDFMHKKTNILPISNSSIHTI